MFIVSAIILSVLLTWHNNRPFTFYVGKPWLYQDLTASMSFKVPRDTAAVVDSLNANFIKETGAQISIDEIDGKGEIEIAAANKDSIEAAVQRIKAIIAVPEEGTISSSQP